MSDPSQNLSLARQYLKSIESGASGDELAQFFAADVIVEIFPSSLFPKGSRSNLEGLRAAADRGKKVMSAQTYEVTNALATGDQVAMEVLWTGTLLVPFQSIPAGGHMRAHFACFFASATAKSSPNATTTATIPRDPPSIRLTCSPKSAHEDI